MRDDFLFSVGVITDEDRPKNHAPQQPVRCFEEELLPKIAEHPKCPRCGIEMFKAHEWGAPKVHAVCPTCVREVRPWRVRQRAAQARKKRCTEE